MIAAGKLNQRINITAPNSSPRNAYGEITASDSTFATIWANILPLNAKEVEVGKSFGATVSHKITIRHRTDLKKSYRITLGTRSFNINAWSDPDGEQRDLIIWATEVLP